MSAIAERPALAPVRPATALLPYEQTSARAARRLVRDKLAEWGLHQLVGDAEVIVSELVGNALGTGCTTRMAVSIRRRTDTVVRIGVRDGSRSLPCMSAAGPEAEGGRGLVLIHHLTGGRWGATLEPFGKTVHADLCTTPRAASGIPPDTR